MMSKKTSNGQKPSAVNPNIPTFVPQSHQWPNIQRSAFMPPMLALPPSTTGAPIWQQSYIGAPLTTGFGFHYGHQMNPQFNQYPPNHSLNCCLNNGYHSRPQCQHNSNNWPNSGPNGCWSQPYDSNPSPNVTIESITELKDNETDEDMTFNSNSTTGGLNSGLSETESQVLELKEMNDKLSASLDETTHQLRQSRKDFLKMNEKLVIDCIEKYQQNLKRYGDYISEECTRFYRNEEMATKLMAIVEQITVASNKAKEVKDRLKRWVADQQKHIKDESNEEINAFEFDIKSLPEFPDLMLFYKSILDEIPGVLLSDLKKNGKRDKLAENVVNDCLIKTSAFEDQTNILSSYPIFFKPTPKLSDLPKPEFSFFNNENVLPLKPAVEPSISSANLPFHRSSSPNALFKAFSNSINDQPIHSSSLLSGLKEDKPIAPIGKRTQIIAESEPIGVKALKNPINEMFGQKNSIQSNSEILPKQLSTNLVYNPNAIQKQKSTLEMSEEAKLALNQAQRKLLAKLKEKYPDLSDEILIDSMSQTKKSLIDSGVQKGFSGMKIADIIGRITEYIDRNVDLLNSFHKSRQPMPTSMLPTNTATADRVQDKHLTPKGFKVWRKVNPNVGKNDDSICSICFDIISVSTKYETECQHFFHLNCISDWIRTDSSCPQCRCHILPPGEYPKL